MIDIEINQFTFRNKSFGAIDFEIENEEINLIKLFV